MEIQHYRQDDMLTAESFRELQSKIREQARASRPTIDNLRAEIAPLKSEIRRIAPRSVSAISIVATDGGNQTFAFDPYIFQIVRVVDSSGRELLIDVTSASTDIAHLSESHLNNGTPKTALGEMMRVLDVRYLWELSPMIPEPNRGNQHSEWVNVYRELAEWAALYSTLQARDFVTDTLILRDGLLRSKVFAGDLFLRLRHNLEDAIARHLRESRRKIYLVGFAKTSKVLTRYRLALALENILTQPYPCYVEIPKEIEKKAYIFPEYAKTDFDTGESPKFAAGHLFMVKLGERPDDPLWAIDVFTSQLEQAHQIVGYVLADARDGFPIPFYPKSLQKAHEMAALMQFDAEVIGDEIASAIRHSFDSSEREVVERVRFQDDLVGRRYE